MSAYTFPFGQTAERRFHTCQVCCHAVFQNLSARRWKQMMYASAERRLVDKWARIGKGVTEEFILNERIVKKNLKRSEIQYKKYRQAAAVDTCHCHCHFSCLYIITSLFSVAGRQTNNSTCQSGPKTGCTTYFARCLHLTAELSVGRRVIPVLSAWCKCTSPLTLLLVPTVNAPQEPHLYTNADSVQQRFKHFPSVIFSSQCV